MLARAKGFRRIAAVLAVGFGISAAGCGKGAYEERLKNTVNQLTQQAAGAKEEAPAAEAEQPAN